MSKTNRRIFLAESAGAALGFWMAGEGRAAPGDAAKEPRRLRILTLEGTPSEIGLKHGKTLREPIGALVKVWKADLAQRYRMKADAFIKKFVQRTDYLPAMKKWTPDLIDEIRGIARGADQDFDTMLVFQLLDEYWVHGPGVAGEHCSALGISRKGDRPSCVAQTMDLEGFRDGFQNVLHIKHGDSKRETLLLSHPGMIGLNGMNNRSIGVCCNTLGQLAPSTTGLPVACVVRGALQQETEKAALQFLHRVKHASGQNYVMGGPTGVHSLECSAGKVSTFTPKTWPEGVWHTNHPLVNDDYSPKYRELLKDKKAAAKKGENSAARLQSLQRRLAKESKGTVLERARAALAAKDSAEHPVCRPYKTQKDFYTFATTIMVLSDKPEFHVAPGPSDIHAYQTFSFHNGQRSSTR